MGFLATKFQDIYDGVDTGWQLETVLCCRGSSSLDVAEVLQLPLVRN